jgi:hypothetical protein
MDQFGTCSTADSWRAFGQYLTARAHAKGGCVREGRQSQYCKKEPSDRLGEPPGVHMSKPSRDVMRLPLEKRVEIALKIAAKKAIDEHFRLGLPIYVWRKGRVMELSQADVRKKSKLKRAR